MHKYIFSTTYLRLLPNTNNKVLKMSNEEVVTKCKGHVVDIYVPALSVPLWPTKLFTLAQSYYKEKVCRLGTLWEYSCFPVQCPGPLYESGLWTTLILHIAQYAAYMQITLLYLPSSGRMQTFQVINPHAHGSLLVKTTQLQGPSSHRAEDIYSVKFLKKFKNIL